MSPNDDLCAEDAYVKYDYPEAPQPVFPEVERLAEKLKPGQNIDIMEKQDNWGAMGTYKCRTCSYFVEKKDNPHVGRCRRHAPTLDGWPVVYDSDWCGDHKLDERKL